MHEQVVGLVVKAPLAEDDVGAGVLDSLDHVDEVVLLHLLEFIVVFGVFDLNAVLGLGLWWLEGASQDANFGILDFLLHRWMREILVNHDTFDELRILNSTAGLCDDLDKVEVNILSFQVSDVEHGLDCKVGKVVLAFRNNFASKGGGGALTQVSVVVLLDIDGLSDFLNFADSNFTGLHETVSDFKRMNSFVKQLLRLF